MSIHVKFITRILNDWSKVILIFNSVSIISDHVINKSIAIQSNSDFITHTHTTHTHWGFHFHIWTFASKTWSLAISIIWHIWMSDKNWLQKRRAKLKTVINNLNYNMFHLSTNVFVIFRIGPMQNTRKFKLLHQKLCMHMPQDIQTSQKQPCFLSLFLIPFYSANHLHSQIT